MDEKILQAVTYQFSQEYPLRIERFLLFGPYRFSLNESLNPNCPILQKIEYSDINNGGELYDKPYEFYHSIDLEQYDLSTSYVILYCCIMSEDDVNVVFRVGNLCKAKVWLNEILIVDDMVHLNDGHFAVAQLKKGHNHIVTQVSSYFDEYDTFRPATFTIRLNSIIPGEDRLTMPSSLFNAYLNNEVIGKLHLVENDWDNCTVDQYEFMLIPKDCINIDPQQVIQLTVSDPQGNELDNISIYLYERNIYPLSKARAKEIDILRLRFRYYINDKSCQFDHHIKIRPINSLVERLEHLFNQFQSYTGMQSYYMDIRARLDMLHDISLRYTRSRPIPALKMDYFHQYTKDIIHMLYYACLQIPYISYIKKNRIHTVFFKSRLDEKIECFQILVPENFSPQTPMPIIFFSSMRRYSWYSRYIYQHFKHIQAVFVDVTFRGYTMGSYIGEASFFEIYAQLEKILCIDENRRYFIGYTTGGFAAWSLLQRHPGFLAAAVIIGGQPQLEVLHNAAQTYILNISGDGDKFYTNGFSKPGKFFKKIQSQIYQQVFLSQADDNTLEYISLSPAVINWLMSKSRIVPTMFSYTTNSWRHNRAHWISIDSMGHGRSPAKIYGSFISPNKIHVKTENVAALSIHFPKEICFPAQVEINTIKYMVPQPTANIAHFKIPDIRATSSPTKGIGLLDVFFDHVTIVADIYDNQIVSPQNYKKIIRNMSQPSTSGYEKEVYISYPVVDISTCQKLITSNIAGNYILIQSANKLNELFSHFPIIINNRGIQYKGWDIQDDYCLYALFRNEDHSYLVIQTNNNKLLSQFILTRSFIITSYCQGQNDFLNADAVMLYKNQYYILHEMGDDFCLA